MDDDECSFLYSIDVLVLALIQLYRVDCFGSYVGCAWWFYVHDAGLELLVAFLPADIFQFDRFAYVEL